MSRVGKKPIPIPAGVKVAIVDDTIFVEGPKGKLSQALRPEVEVEIGDKEAVVHKKNETRIGRSMHGLYRSLLSNMVSGVVEPFKKSLEISGVGYRAEMVGDAVKLMVGLSHEVLHPIPKGVTCAIDKQTLVHLSSCDKELLGRTAAALRAYRPCEPYKGKGVKYVGERIRRKEGKTGAG